MRTGKLIKGGEPDLFNVAVHIINDWQRGKLPFFVAPPKQETDDDDNVNEEEQDDAPLEVRTYTIHIGWKRSLDHIIKSNLALNGLHCAISPI